MEPSINHVPVFVDSTHYTQEINKTRFTYFYVECAEPHATSYQEYEASLPLLLIDLEGVIVSGLGGNEYLETAEVIIELFDFIDEHTPYVVGVSYLWLPNELLREYITDNLSRGDVLRVFTPLFLEACTPQGITNDIDLIDIPSDVQAIYFSKKETTAFKIWTDQTVERVKKRYREQPDMNLRVRQERKGS